MAGYRFRCGKSLENESARLIQTQIDRALGEIDTEEIGVPEKVHRVRKRCKKIRAILRLVRYGVGDDRYRSENQWYRDTARLLSEARDLRVTLRCCRRLEEEVEDEGQEVFLKNLASRIRMQHEGVKDDGESIKPRLEKSAERLKTGRTRLEDWKFMADGERVLKKGLKKTFSRGEEAMKVAMKSGEAADFHEWRKRAKYHMYHSRLLRNCWKPIIRSHCKVMKKLADALGDDHDLSIVEDLVSSIEGVDSESYEMQRLHKQLQSRHQQLRREALNIGLRIHAEKPKSLSRRFANYWLLAGKLDSP